jgi:hypothetical protein
MAKEDPVIEEIRESRKRMSAECGHDPRKFIEYMKQFNEKYADQVREWEKSFGRGQRSKDK